jgi:hypothetical protein
MGVWPPELYCLTCSKFPHLGVGGTDRPCIYQMCLFFKHVRINVFWDLVKSCNKIILTKSYFYFLWVELTNQFMMLVFLQSQPLVRCSKLWQWRFSTHFTMIMIIHSFHFLTVRISLMTLKSIINNLLAPLPTNPIINHSIFIFNKCCVLLMNVFFLTELTEYAQFVTGRKDARYIVTYSWEPLLEVTELGKKFYFVLSSCAWAEQT